MLSSEICTHINSHPYFLRKKFKPNLTIETIITVLDDVKMYDDEYVLGTLTLIIRGGSWAALTFGRWWNLVKNPPSSESLSLPLFVLFGLGMISCKFHNTCAITVTDFQANFLMKLVVWLVKTQWTTQDQATLFSLLLVYGRLGKTLRSWDNSTFYSQLLYLMYILNFYSPIISHILHQTRLFIYFMNMIGGLAPVHLGDHSRTRPFHFHLIIFPFSCSFHWWWKESDGVCPCIYLSTCNHKKKRREL